MSEFIKGDREDEKRRERTYSVGVKVIVVFVITLAFR